MGQFPEREMDVVKLGEDMHQGLTNNPGVFPNPPVSPPDLLTALLGYIGKHDAAVAAYAAAEQATTDKDASFVELVDLIKDNLTYCRNTVDDDDDKMKLVGSSGRKPPTPLEKPGETRALHIVDQGPARISLDWKAPTDGGKPSAYSIQRRAAGTHDWLDAGMAVITEATLFNQPTGAALEYHVIAVNKAGQGKASGIVDATL